MTAFALIDTSDGCEIHGEGCSHIKRTEGSMKALRGARSYQGESVQAVVAQWYAELAVDFGEEAEGFYATVLPCARKAEAGR